MTTKLLTTNEKFPRRFAPGGDLLQKLVNLIEGSCAMALIPDPRNRLQVNPNM